MPVAYFSAEFGMHESMPIYSGGLGVLSGDHIKSASGLGVNLVAIGCFTIKAISSSSSMRRGYQREEYLETPRSKTCRWSRLCHPDGKPITDSHRHANKARMFAKVWVMQVGRVPKLYLLDCDVEGNSPEDRELTSRLYGGDERTRIRQELVLGVGGVKALRALGIHARRVSLERRT
jgi:glycogen phosphorylase